MSDPATSDELRPDFDPQPRDGGSALDADLVAAFNAAWDCATLGVSLHNRLVVHAAQKASKNKQARAYARGQMPQDTARLACQLKRDLPYYRTAIKKVQARLNAVRESPIRFYLTEAAPNAHVAALDFAENIVGVVAICLGHVHSQELNAGEIVSRMDDLCLHYSKHRSGQLSADELVAELRIESDKSALLSSPRETKGELLAEPDILLPESDSKAEALDWRSALEAGYFDDLSTERTDDAFADAMVSVPDSLSYFSRDETAPLGMCMLALSTWVATGTFTGMIFLIRGPAALEKAKPTNVRGFLQEVRKLWAYLDAKERFDPKWLFQVAKSRDCREFELQGKFYPSACHAIFEIGKEAYWEAHEIVLGACQSPPPYDSFDARQWASALPALNQHFTEIAQTRGQEITTLRSKLFAALQQEIAAVHPGFAPAQPDVPAPDNPVDEGFRREPESRPMPPSSTEASGSGINWAKIMQPALEGYRDQAAYHFRKLEGREMTPQALREYFAVHHPEDSDRTDPATLSSILERDYTQRAILLSEALQTTGRQVQVSAPEAGPAQLQAAAPGKAGHADPGNIFSKAKLFQLLGSSLETVDELANDIEYHYKKWGFEPSAELLDHLRIKFPQTVRETLRDEVTPALEAMPVGGTPIDGDAKQDKAASERMRQFMEQLALAIGDNNTARILAIAGQKELTIDQRMTEIIRLDARFRGKNSVDWGKLLDEDPRAVRMTSAWKKLRQRQQSDD